MSEKKYIYNQSNDGSKANILIDGDIDAWWGHGLLSLSKDIANSEADSVMLQINSGGGQVTEGRAMEAYIKGSPKDIHTSVLGICASIATFPAMAGKTTSIAKGSLFMIHQVHGGEYGESEDLKQTAALMDKMNGQIADGYVDVIEGNGKLINGNREETKIQVVEWMKANTFFTAEQAVEHGFIQTLVDGVEFLNKSTAQRILNSCSKYNNVPTDFINNIQNIVNMADETPKNNDAQEETKGMFAAIKGWFASKEGKSLVSESVKASINEEAQALEDAKALIESSGLKIVSDEPATVENKAIEEKEEPKKEELSEVEQLKAKLEAAELKAQKLEEEKAGAPSAKPHTEKANNSTDSPFSKEHLEGFAAIANALPNR